MTNWTCPIETAQSGPSLFQNGNLVFQGALAPSSLFFVCLILSFSASCTSKFLDSKSVSEIVMQVGWIVAGFFTIIACFTSFWLIDRHLQWYTNVRIFCLVEILVLTRPH